MAILAGILLTALTLPWFPSPSGWILLVAAIYIGLPMILMVINDLSALRQARMLARNLEVFPPTPEDPVAWFDVKFEALAAEHMRRWRRWFPWLLGLLAIALVAALVDAPLSVVVALGLIGLGRETFLAVNVLEWLVPANWSHLSLAERLRLRLCLLFVAVITGAIAAGVLAFIYYLFFIRAEPLRWNVFAFTGVYGMLAWPCGAASIRCFRRVFRRIPPDERPSERPV